MKQFIVFLFYISSMYAQSSFITQMEYASLLYKNPRGIGCHKCHGLYGEGKLIAKYSITKKVKEANQEYTIKIPKEFRSPAINHLTYDQFVQAFNEPQQGMPKYYLTQKELKALFFYLQQVNLERKNGKKH